MANAPAAEAAELPAPTLAVAGVASSLAAIPSPPAHENPAAVYLASLAPGSRRTMRRALELLAREFSGGALGPL